MSQCLYNPEKYFTEQTANLDTELDLKSINISNSLSSRLRRSQSSDNIFIPLNIPTIPPIIRRHSVQQKSDNDTKSSFHIRSNNPFISLDSYRKHNMYRSLSTQYIESEVIEVKHITLPPTPLFPKCKKRITNPFLQRNADYSSSDDSSVIGIDSGSDSETETETECDFAQTNVNNYNYHKFKDNNPFRLESVDDSKQTIALHNSEHSNTDLINGDGMTVHESPNTNSLGIVTIVY